LFPRSFRSCWTFLDVNSSISLLELLGIPSSVFLS
jgi:hypothetical protein